MRSAKMTWILVLGLSGVVASQAAAQDQAAQEVTATAQVQRAAPVPATAVLPAHLDPAARVERPGAGPRLPEFVASIALPVEAPAAAPPSNIVIPVTTLTIVLAVVLLIVLID